LCNATPAHDELMLMPLIFLCLLHAPPSAFCLCHGNLHPEVLLALKLSSTFIFTRTIDGCRFSSFRSVESTLFIRNSYESKHN
jgi:hypothetical protein